MKTLFKKKETEGESKGRRGNEKKGVKAHRAERRESEWKRASE